MGEDKVLEADYRETQSVEGDFISGDKVVVLRGKYKGNSGTITKRVKKNKGYMWGVKLDNGTRVAFAGSNLDAVQAPPSQSTSASLDPVRRSKPNLLLPKDPFKQVKPSYYEYTIWEKGKPPQTFRCAPTNPDRASISQVASPLYRQVRTPRPNK